MAKQDSITYEEIVRKIRNRDFSPIYYLMGEEDYYIDRISEYIANTVLKEEERDFNLTVLYGMETNINSILDAARRFPIMAEYQVIIIKEAQSLGNIELLADYLQKPQKSTLLVFCHKHGTLDRRKKICELIKNNGVLYESKKLYDSQIPGFITTYLKRQNCQIEPQAILILSSYVGANLNRLSSELDKLILHSKNDNSGRKTITSEDIESCVGISKEYNSFSLLNALVEKNVYQANLIVNILNKNTKANPIQAILATLFNFFSNLMQAYYAPVKTEEGIANWLEQPQWMVARSILPAMKKYSGVKVMNIISEIRKTDAKSKGIKSTANTSSSDLLQDLVFFILH